MNVLIWCAVAYIIGSIPFAVLATYAVTGKDIRSLGTGNPGAANVARTVGKRWGILVWFADTIKSIVSLSIARNAGVLNPVCLTLVGIAAIAGHCFSVFLRFHGGKGVAAMGGVVLFLMPRVFPLAIILWFLAQKLNPRSVTIAVQCLVIFFLCLYLLYPRDLFLPLAASIVILVGFGTLINRDAIRDMRA